MGNSTENKKTSDTYSMRCGSEYAEILREASNNYPSKQDFAKALIDALLISELELSKLSNAVNKPEYSEHKVVNGFLLVPCNNFELRCLEYLTAREKSELENDKITPGMIYQYILRTWFINGDAFGLNSIPDSQIRKIKERVKDGDI